MLGDRLFGGVWNAAEKWRFGFFLRRYHAADSSQHVQLERAASHLAALQMLALPEVSFPLIRACLTYHSTSESRLGAGPC